MNSLEAHREVMQTKAYSFVKPKFFEKLLGEFLGRGVLFSVGAEHRLQRRFLAGKSNQSRRSWRESNRRVDKILTLGYLRALFNAQYSQVTAHFSREGPRSFIISRA